MRYTFIILPFLSLSLLVNCRNSQDRITEAINEMRSRPVSIPFSKMSCWINDSVQNNRPWEQAELKLVVYTDSVACSQCTFKQLYLWKDFVELENKYNDKFYIFFIIQSGSNTTKDLTSNFHYTGLNHPIYIDSTNVFIKSNPHIPSEEIYHVFLLNENDSIILVGNPVFNAKIEDMLIKQVGESLKQEVFQSNLFELVGRGKGARKRTDF